MTIADNLLEQNDCWHFCFLFFSFSFFLLTGYLSEVFQDAQVYSQHANKTALDVEDVRLAVQMRVNTSFTQPPPREVILEIAQQKNSQPLPPIPQKFGIRLPPEQHCLTQPNYQLDTKKMKVDEEK
eukprot:TRINITY_DN2491_c0_g1_i1.p1 TRINITY_DN2491_c0_g1~~TRINITY_DN2491_c0_g1_i1.p1  ORF type:complete len:126 (+),score=30.80 TRINITY_DN2491_c0_g1_i1:413-790(+)